MQMNHKNKTHKIYKNHWVRKSCPD